MSSAVYFKFKASLKQYTIPFEGSSISVRDLRNSIKLQCGLKSSDFELQILDKQGKEYSKEEDLIPKFSDLVVRRMPKASDPPKKKIHNPEDMTRRDPYKMMNNFPKSSLNNTTDLAKANIPDDEKIDIMANRGWEEYSEKNFQVKSKPYGVPPPSYVCNKCHQGGHWIHECPGLRDKDGRLLDFKTVKRPTGIPQDFLLEVEPGTPGAYLTKEGKYMVPIKDAEAYALGKREKRPFSLEENPPYIEKEEQIPPIFKCQLCNKLLENPTCVPCCSTTYCYKCITDYLYDPEVNGSRQCPKCHSNIVTHTSLKEYTFLRQFIHCWKANMLPKEIVDSYATTIDQFSIKKTELNEDSSKSPEMKFDSANADVVDIKDVKLEEVNKVFVNNRRVLRPKLSTNAASSESISTAKVIEGTDANTSEPTTEENKEESVEIKKDDTSKEEALHVEKKIPEDDVNDLIFSKVEDFESFSTKRDDSEKVETNITSNNNTNSVTSLNSRDHHYSQNSRDTHLKIETISKRPDNGLRVGIDRKYDRHSYHSNNRIDTKSLTANGLATSLQAVNALMETTKANLINTHFPVSVPQQPTQMLNNPLPITTLDMTQWPLMNPICNSVPLQNILNSVNVNGMINPPNWMGNTLNLPNSHGLAAPTKRILTEEEFYERQRQLRAQKYNNRSSRSPSGSQSPKRRNNHIRHQQRHKYRSKSNERQRRHKHHASSRQRDQRNYEMENKEYHRKYNHSSKPHRSSTNRHSDHDRRNLYNESEIKKEYQNAEMKDIDPKLMHDSINTFLKYITGCDSKDVRKNNGNIDNQSQKTSNYHESRVKREPEVISSSMLRSKKRSASKSPILNKINKYICRSRDNKDIVSVKAECLEQRLKSDDRDNHSEIYSDKSKKSHSNDSTLKLKKVKTKHNSDEEITNEEISKKKHKKHKKHKHKKTKKSKKQKQSS